MKIKFWGAAQTVTGSMHLLELDSGTKVLLDCGLYQGREGFAQEYNRSFPCDPAEIDFLILSHAHIDHCGNIPQLVKHGFKGRIFSTHATYDLVTILLQDSAKIQESDAKRANRWRAKKNKPLIVPLYSPKDVPVALGNFVTLSYENWHRISDEVELLFLDAGHMLGSASVNLRIQDGDRTHRIGFTGDIGRYDSLILRDPQPMPQCDVLISESTYGGKVHQVLDDADQAILDIVKHTCIDKKGKLIIPAFSVGRTQNIIHTLDKLESKGLLPKIPVYVDSPMAVNATGIFEAHPECYDEDLQNYLIHDENPFGFNELHYVRSVDGSKAINDSKDPCIIISASGMMTAGRILHHLRNNIENEATTILVVGYCARGTLGERIVNGAEEVKIHGKPYKVNAEVKILNSFSGHAGQDELLKFIDAGQNPQELKHIYLVHGEGKRGEMFREFLNSNGYTNVTVPARGDVIEL